MESILPGSIAERVSRANNMYHIVNILKLLQYCSQASYNCMRVTHSRCTSAHESEYYIALYAYAWVNYELLESCLHVVQACLRV